MDIISIKGVGAKRAEQFNKLGVYSVEDLMYHFPRAYKDLSSPSSEVKAGEFTLLKGRLVKVSTFGFKGRKLKKTTAKFEGEVNFDAVWWNMPYIASSLSVGEDYFVFGKAVSARELANPKIESAVNNRRLKGIVPIYKKTTAQSQNVIHDCIEKGVELFNDELADLVFGSSNEMMRKVHFPTSVKEGEDALSSWRALRLASLSVAHFLTENPIKRTFEDVGIDDYLCKLPFALTESQNAVIGEIKRDLIDGNGKRRIVVGDTGSGKSAVAYAVMKFVNVNGYKAVLIAPTEILARQHHDNMTTYGFRSVLVTSSTLNSRIVGEINSGNYDVLCGTESLLNDKLDLSGLALVVVDEQHRFGVATRGALERKYGAYSLSLSATPIPRTQVLGLFGLKMSYLRSTFVANRKTFVMSGAKLDGFYEYITNKENCSVFVVCPRIEDEEGEEMFSAKSLYEELVAKGVCDGKIALVHGGMSAKDKAETMAGFASGETRLLVSTTVIEVGIDVERANVILVLNADRFSVATLHQLRGRVGRNGGYSECYFHTDTKNEETLKRIKFVAENTDGSKLAEYDLNNRGSGDVFGMKQSGQGESFGSVEIEKSARYREIILKNRDLFTEKYLEKYSSGLSDLTLS